MSDQVSAAEAALVARDQERQPWKQAFVLLLAGSPSYSEVAALIEERIAYTPRFRQIVEGWPMPRWVDDQGFHVQGHLKEYRLAAGERLQDWLSARLVTGFDRSHPLWDAWLVSSVAPGLSALVVFSHPALVDGYDHVHLLQELLDSGPVDPGPAQAWRPQRGEVGWAGLLQGWDDPLRAAKGLVGGLEGMAHQARRTFTAAARPQHVAGVEVELETVRRIRRRLGCTTHDVILALVTAGIRHWCLGRGVQPADQVALVPLAVTGAGAVDSAVGAMIAPQWIALPIGEPSSAERLTTVSVLTRSRIDNRVGVPVRDLTGLAGFAPPTLHSLAARTLSAGRSHAVWVSNAPGPDQPRYLGRSRVTSWYSLLGTTDEQELTASVSSLQGRVTIGMVASTGLDGLAGAISAELRSLDQP